MGPFTLPCKTPGLDRISPPLLSAPPQASANSLCGPRLPGADLLPPRLGQPPVGGSRSPERQGDPPLRSHTHSVSTLGSPPASGLSFFLRDPC